MASRWPLRRGLTGARPIHTAVGSESRGPQSHGRLVCSRATCGKPHGAKLDQGGTGLFGARIAGTGELYLCKLGSRPAANRKQSLRLSHRWRRNASVQDNSCPRYLLRLAGNEPMSRQRPVCSSPSSHPPEPASFLLRLTQDDSPIRCTNI
jgi:hypothetical protein